MPNETVGRDATVSRKVKIRRGSRRLANFDIGVRAATVSSHYDAGRDDEFRLAPLLVKYRIATSTNPAPMTWLNDCNRV